MKRAGEVFDAAEAIGEGARGFAPGEDEGKPERDRGHSIADIVDRIGEKRDGT